MLERSFIPFPVITTQRLILRQLSIADEQEIFTLRSDVEINKYLGRQLSKTIDDARNFINMINENTDKNESVYWAITLKEDNALIGTICLFNFSDENQACEIGYELLTKFQGKGIMQEAAEKVIDHAFNIIKVKKIEAVFHKDNRPSIKLVQKFSFKDSKFFDHTEPDLVGYHLTDTNNIKTNNI